MKNYLFILSTATFFYGCSHDSSVSPEGADTEPLKANATIMAKSNSNVTGMVTFTQTKDTIFMTATLSGLSPGSHAIHIHAIGDCSADDGSSAGGHWNPTNVDHGKWGTAPFHIGDIGNIVADSNGNGTISRETDLWCINCDDETKDIIGKAIIIHQGIDDFSSQPSGAAGSRIGCGKVMAQE
jgi:Cu-Zn family superoxide dismutase